MKITPGFTIFMKMYRGKKSIDVQKMFHLINKSHRWFTNRHDGNRNGASFLQSYNDLLNY